MKIDFGQQTFVAVDLETTGLTNADKIIEIGLVKFNATGVLDEFSSLINPHTNLSKFITELTGISQEDVDSAPDLEHVRAKIQKLLTGCDLVAHNARFDERFLKSNKLQVGGNVYDTLEIAQTILPNQAQYDLRSMAQLLNIPQERAHRALDDAKLAYRIFLGLAEKLNTQPKELLDGFAHLNRGYDWSPGILANLIKTAKEWNGDSDNSINQFIEKIGKNAVHLPAKDVREKQDDANADDYLSAVDKVFARDGVLSQILPNFTYRATQAQMTKKIARIMLNRKDLIAEAGTGIGKSLSYLIPAALHSVLFGSRVVVSTYTINLQEQLMQKDIAITRAVLAKMGFQDDLKVAILKGRTNYLCYKNWQRAILDPPTDRDQATLLGKSLLWLPDSETGDREEINLSWLRTIFNRYSAENSSVCKFIGRDEPCFLNKARQNSLNADIVITNHSLLISDTLSNSKLLPQYDLLVIDEAQHLKDVATNTRTFEYTREGLLELVGQIKSDMSSLLNQHENKNAGLKELQNSVTSLNKHNNPVEKLFDVLEECGKSFLSTKPWERQIRIKDDIRKREIWEDIRVNWRDVKVLVQQIEHMTQSIYQNSGQMDLIPPIQTDLEKSLQSMREMKQNLEGFFEQPQDNIVYWLECVNQANAAYKLKGAPIDVSKIIGENLFAENVSNVMIGATLSYEGQLDRFTSEIGITTAVEDIFTTDFDYKNNAISFFVSGMPEPNAEDSPLKWAEAIRSIFMGVQGRVLVLFTAKSKMKKTANALRNMLNEENVEVVVQQVNGGPRQIQKMLIEKERIIACGTSSMWEGMDMGNSQLDAVVIPQLPFPVPTDPIHASRAELHKSPFNDYSLPEAIRKFLQGFGRLIRNHSDKGIFVILDSRILTRYYSSNFLTALPSMPLKKPPLAELKTDILTAVANFKNSTD